jgi:hypothetical protein
MTNTFNHIAYTIAARGLFFHKTINSIKFTHKFKSQYITIWYIPCSLHMINLHLKSICSIFLCSWAQ